MKYLSVCSGIEAATVAWHPLGWQPVGFSEIEKFPSRVLAHHYPNVRNYGDITNHKRWDVGYFRLLVGGTPCQSFSVAGLRKGMADPRGNLALTYLGIVDDHRPDWFVWENVPGVLSSNGGRDFGAFLGGLVELGYGFAYRVLDAQYVRVDGYGRAVPQRRRRVFVVGNSRSWRRAAAVLFERESLSGNSAPRREAGEGVAGTIDAGTHPGSYSGQDAYQDRLIAHALRGEGFDASEDGTGRGTPIVPVVAKTLTRGAESAGKGGYAGRRQEDDDNLVAREVINAGSSKANSVEMLRALRVEIGEEAFAEWGLGISNSLQSSEILRPVMHGESIRRETDEAGRGMDDGSLSRQKSDAARAMREMREAGERCSSPGRKLPKQLAGELSASLSRLSSEGASVRPFLYDLRQASEGLGVLQSALPAIQGRQNWAVRRLTPLEAERLQGFPDGYTNISKAADGPRYKALGNSMACNVMRWVGQRIQMVDDLVANLTP